MLDASGIVTLPILLVQFPLGMVVSLRPKRKRYTNSYWRCRRYVCRIHIVDYVSRLLLVQRSFEILKPGLHMDAVQFLCHRTLVKGFQRLGIFKSPNSPGSGSWNSEDAILA